MSPRGRISEVVAVPTKKEVLLRRTVELPTSPVALLAVNNPRTAEPWTFPAEVTLRKLDRDRIIVIAFLARSSVRDDELQSKDQPG